MLSLKVETNMSEVITLITERLEGINFDELTALQASTVMAEMRKRIHIEGKDSNDAQIGTYSPAYMKVRTGLYGDTKTAKSGVVKTAGVKSKGANKGSQRAKYQRGSDTKVILSLTRQMEKSMILIPFKNGCGIGYATEESFKKSQWNELTYKKKIFYLTKKEREIAIAKGQEYINETLK